MADNMRKACGVMMMKCMGLGKHDLWTNWTIIRFPISIRSGRWSNDISRYKNACTFPPPYFASLSQNGIHLDRSRRRAGIQSDTSEPKEPTQSDDDFIDDTEQNDDKNPSPKALEEMEENWEKKQTKKRLEKGEENFKLVNLKSRRYKVIYS